MANDCTTRVDIGRPKRKSVRIRSGPIPGTASLPSTLPYGMPLEGRLAAWQRLVGVGRLAAGVAHEINNPLASVLANLELLTVHVEALAQRGPIDPQLREALRDARESAEHARQVALDLKLSSVQEDSGYGLVDVQSVLHSAVRMAWFEIRARAKLVTSYGDIPLVEANEARLRQVFLNLLVNGAHAISKGNIAGNELRITTSVNPAGEVVVCVADTGCGMAASVQRCLFTPFFTTKPADVGTGLGLSICRRIVESLGGSIAFTSAVGKGTEFRVVLPPAGTKAAA